ncbi:ABC transporter permease [Nakamurella lactea]|uniref:ABC transporter permease n=1 Tax=Nakamurella lactea TaxID=459515 RepID=UPI00041D62C3|nr:ABC transporter permease [Nakamurella lactea]
MGSYVLKRLGTSLVVILGVTFVSFALLHIISPSPGRTVLGLEASPEAVAAFNTENGYDRPFLLQYGSYLWKLLHFDLGYSYKLNQSVVDLFGQNAGRTAVLVSVSLIIALFIAVPLGIAQAVKRNSIMDYTVTTVAFTTYAMPSFFLGMVLIEVFSLRLGIFPAQASQSTSPWVVFTDPVSMALPVLSLVAITVALYSRYQRSAALDELVADYVRVGRAKGLTMNQVVRRHVVRNALLPLISLIGMTLPLVLAGNLVIEQVFNYPGLGLLFYKSLESQDYPVLLAYALVTGVLTVIGNFAADVALTFADPRIKLR